MTIAEQQLKCGVIHNQELLTDFQQEYFFNSYSFLVRNSKNQELFTFFLNKANQIVSKIILVKEDSILRSSQYAPFSFFETLSEQEIELLIQFVINWAKNNQISKIILKTPPTSYLTFLPNTYQLLFKNNFTISVQDVNFYLKVDTNDFRSKIALAERSKLNKCIKANFTFQEESFDNFSKIYQVLKSCRDKKGYQISMTEQSLKKMIDYFPSKYLLFSVKNEKNEIIAASVSIIINQQILYTFYWGDDVNYRSYSPVVFLLQGIYKYCQKHLFELMDLGTSSLNGKISQGTYNFKKHIGGVLDDKCVFEYHI